MSYISKINKSGLCEITQYFDNSHKGLDIVGKNYTIDDVTAHSDGVVYKVKNNIKYNSYGKDNSYGNYVIIKHPYKYTLYSHLAHNTIKVTEGERIKSGEIIGKMGNTGSSNGIHLHFEVRELDNTKIDPFIYLNNDLETKKEDDEYYIIKKGDTLSSIAKKYNTKVDILVKENNIENSDLIYIGQKIKINNNIKYLKNSNNNTSIVDALKQINIDSSFNHRKKLAKLNGILNYTGTSSQNIQLLKLLKEGRLISD